MAQYVIISGNPVDGITVWGKPQAEGGGAFEDANEAGQLASEGELRKLEWWIVELEPLDG